jgi:hypothetical protein
MRKKVKIVDSFDNIWAKAEKANAAYGPVTGFDAQSSPRFHRIFEKRLPTSEKGSRYLTMGIYDSVSKRYVTFDTINLSGNFRYNNRAEPPEFKQMLKMIDKV